MKKNLNQNLINLIDYYNLLNTNFLLSNYPIKRVGENVTIAFAGNKREKLEKLKKKFNLLKIVI